MNRKVITTGNSLCHQPNGAVIPLGWQSKFGGGFLKNGISVNLPRPFLFGGGELTDNQTSQALPNGTRAKTDNPCFKRSCHLACESFVRHRLQLLDHG
jgi:hypothetical protein